MKEGRKEGREEEWGEREAVPGNPLKFWSLGHSQTEQERWVRSALNHNLGHLAIVAYQRISASKTESLIHIWWLTHQDLINSLLHSTCQKESLSFTIQNQQYGSQMRNMTTHYIKHFMVLTVSAYYHTTWIFPFKKLQFNDFLLSIFWMPSTVLRK